jgi:AcrR family transcriptional regulator
MSTKDLIKENSIMLFAEHGYKGTAINDIANAVGIKKGSFYGHYGSKEELFLELIKEEVKKFLSFVETYTTSVHDNPIMEKLYLLFKKEVEYLYKNKAASKFLMRFTFFPSADIKKIINCNLEIQVMRNQINDCNRPMFKCAIEEGAICNNDLEELMESFFWLVNTTVIKSLFYDKNYNEENIKNIWYHYVNGIKGT